MKAAFLYDQALTRDFLGEGHPLRPSRLRLVYELLEAYGLLHRPDTLLLAPRAATESELLSFHARDYVESVKALSAGEHLERQYRYGFSGDGDNPVTEGMYEAASLNTGASLVAAEAVADGRVEVAFNAAGGFHHAGEDFASGFCIFNDPVIAIRSLLAKGFRRVAYIDIDTHHGDGVQNAFASSPSVLTISLHESGRYLFPGTGHTTEIGQGEGEGFSVNVPLAPFTDDATYLWAFREVVPPLVRAFGPDVLVTQLGIDTHADDPLSHLALTSHGYAEAVRELKALSPGRWLALGGGGYNLSAVARCWTLAYAVMLGVDLPDEVPSPFAEKHGIARLHDPPPAPMSTARRNEVEGFARESVTALQATVFPRVLGR
ncbi:MAG: acetoin utilization protein AcuC [Chloroflexi bacterium]|nr:acetoin utilization protein AcuC [Chloroflexota bacterium]